MYYLDPQFLGRHNLAARLGQASHKVVESWDKVLSRRAPKKMEEWLEDWK